MVLVTAFFTVWRTGLPDAVTETWPAATSSKIFVSPNPVSDELNLKIADEGKIEIKLFNFSGDCVQKHSEDYYIRDTNIKIYINNIPQGIYYIKVFANNKFIDWGKIVVVR